MIRDSMINSLRRWFEQIEKWEVATEEEKKKLLENDVVAVDWCPFCGAHTAEHGECGFEADTEEMKLFVKWVLAKKKDLNGS